MPRFPEEDIESLLSVDDLVDFEIEQNDYAAFFDVDASRSFLSSVVESDDINSALSAFRTAFVDAAAKTGAQSFRFTGGSVLSTVGIPETVERAVNVFPTIFSAVSGMMKLGNEEMSPGEAMLVVATGVWESLPGSVRDALEEAVQEAVEAVVTDMVESLAGGAADAISSAGYIGAIIGTVIKLGIGIAKLVRMSREEAKSKKEQEEFLRAMSADEFSVFNLNRDRLAASTVKTILAKRTSNDFWNPIFAPPGYGSTVVELKNGVRVQAEGSANAGIGLLPHITYEGVRSLPVDVPGAIEIGLAPNKYGDIYPSVNLAAFRRPTSAYLAGNALNHASFNGFPAVMNVDWMVLADAWGDYIAGQVRTLTIAVRDLWRHSIDPGSNSDYHKAFWFWNVYLIYTKVYPFGFPGDKDLLDAWIATGKRSSSSYAAELFKEIDGTDPATSVPLPEKVKERVTRPYFQRMVDLQRNALNSMNSAYMRVDDPVFTTSYGMYWKDKLEDNKRAILDHRPTLCRVDRRNIRDEEYLKEVNNRLFGNPNGPKSVLQQMQACPLPVAAGVPEELILPPATDPYKKPKKAYVNLGDTQKPPISEKTFVERFGPAFAAAGVSATAVYLALKHYGVLGKIKL